MFNSKGLLDQLVKVGGSMLKNQQGNAGAAGPSVGTDFDPILKGLLTGVGGGMLGSMLSGKSNALSKLGGGAALATLAYRAYQNYAANNGGTKSFMDAISGMMEGEGPKDDAMAPEGQMQQSSADAKVLLVAIINVAKADGVFDAAEQAAIATEVEKFASDPQMLTWVKNELAKPIDVGELAHMVKNPQMATEVYLASLAACRDPNGKEEAYLEALREALHIDPGLKRSIEETLFS